MSIDCFWRSAKAMFCSIDGGARSPGILLGIETPMKGIVVSAWSSMTVVGDTGGGDEPSISTSLSDEMLVNACVPVMMERPVENVRVRFT
jgi:hypothetical protein